MAICERCGDHFSRAEHEEWKKLCFSCWKEKKFGGVRPDQFDAPSTIGDVWGRCKVTTQKLKWSDDSARLRADNERLKVEINKVRRVLMEVQERLAVALFELTVERSVKKTTSSDAFLKKNIKHLLMLCHPDKHNNGAKATAITSWLIDYKRRI